VRWVDVGDESDNAEFWAAGGGKLLPVDEFVRRNLERGERYKKVLRDNAQSQF